MSRYAPVEVYPLFASVVLALSCAGYALKRKWVNDPNVYGRKSVRMRGVHVDFEGIEDVKPIYSTAKMSVSAPLGQGIHDRETDEAEEADVGVVPEILEAEPEVPAETSKTD